MLEGVGVFVADGVMDCVTLGDSVGLGVRDCVPLGDWVSLGDPVGEGERVTDGD